VKNISIINLGGKKMKTGAKTIIQIIATVGLLLLIAAAYAITSKNNIPSSIAAGKYHSVALNSDGSLSAWGLNFSDQCDVPDDNW